VATVDQTGGSEGVSDINQEGNDNLAEVTQSEDSGASNTFNTPANIADIDQVGGNARARVEQNNGDARGPSNTAVIEQFSYDGPDGSTVPSGYALNSRIIQDGTDNQSSINQTGFNAAPFFVITGSGLTARNDQFGDGNRSTINQEGLLDADPYTDADVFQDGEDNESEISQAGSNIDADVRQVGAGNYSGVAQTGDDQVADVNQEGDGNSSTVSQLSFSGLGAGGSNADVDQTGDNNTSDVTQDTTGFFADGSGATVTVIRPEQCLLLLINPEAETTLQLLKPHRALHQAF